MGIYNKRKILRKKERKHDFHQEKSKIQEKRKENMLTTKKKKVRNQELSESLKRYTNKTHTNIIQIIYITMPHMIYTVLTQTQMLHASTFRCIQSIKKDITLIISIKFLRVPACIFYFHFRFSTSNFKFVNYDHNRNKT